MSKIIHLEDFLSRKEQLALKQWAKSQQLAPLKPSDRDPSPTKPRPRLRLRPQPQPPKKAA